MATLKVGEIWRDARYYLRDDGQFMAKYLLVLAKADKGDDVICAAFTSQPNGLTVSPACNHGPPRAGYFVGIPPPPFTKQTWVDFSSVNTEDELDVARRVTSGRYTKTSASLTPALFCAVLRCLCQCGLDDLTQRQRLWVQNTIATLNCPP